MKYLCEEYSSLLYRDYADAVMEVLAENEKTDVRQMVEDQIAQSKRNGVELDDEGAIREIVADASGQIFTDASDFASMVEEKAPTVWQKIKKLVRKAINRVRELYAGKQKNDELSEAIRPNLERLAKKMDPMLADAAEARQRAGAMDGITSFITANEYDDNGVSESKAIIRIVNSNIEKMSEENIFEAEGDGIVPGLKSDYINDIFISQGGVAERNDIGIIRLSKSGAKSTVFHGYGKNKLIAAKAIKDVIEKGNIICVTKDYKEKGSDRIIIAGYGRINQMKSVMAVAIISSTEKNNTKSFYLHEVVVNEKDTTPFMTAKSVKTETMDAVSFDNSIAQNGVKSTEVSKKISEDISITDEKTSYKVREGGQEKRRQTEAEKKKERTRELMAEIEKISKTLGKEEAISLQEGINRTLLEKVIAGEVSATVAAKAIMITGRNNRINSNQDMVTSTAELLENADISEEEMLDIIKTIESEMDAEDGRKPIYEVSDRELALIDEALEKYVTDSRSYAVLAEYKKAVLDTRDSAKRLAEVKKRLNNLTARKKIGVSEREEIRNLIEERKELRDKIDVGNNRITELEDTKVLRDVQMREKRNVYRSRRLSEHEKYVKETEKMKENYKKKLEHETERVERQSEKKIAHVVEVANKRVADAKGKRETDKAWQKKHYSEWYKNKAAESRDWFREHYKEKYQNRLEKHREQVAERTERARILSRLERAATRLDRMLKSPNRKQNIPTALQDKIASLLEVIPIYNNFAWIDDKYRQLDGIREKIAEAEVLGQDDVLETLRVREKEVLDKIRELTGKENNRGMAERAETLAQIIPEFQKFADDNGLYAEFAPGLAEGIGRWVAEIRDETEQNGRGKDGEYYGADDGGKILNMFNIPMSQLRRYADIVEMVSRTITDIHTLHDIKRNRDLGEVGSKILADFEDIRKKNKSDKFAGRAFREGMRRLGVWEMTPTYYREYAGTYGDETVGRLDNCMFGENGYAEKTRTIDRFRDSLVEKYHTDKWLPAGSMD